MSEEIKAAKQSFRLAVAQLEMLGVDPLCPRCSNFDPGGPGHCKAGEPTEERLHAEECPGFEAAPDGADPLA